MIYPILKQTTFTRAEKFPTLLTTGRLPINLPHFHGLTVEVGETAPYQHNKNYTKENKLIMYMYILK